MGGSIRGEGGCIYQLTDDRHGRLAAGDSVAEQAVVVDGLARGTSHHV